MDGDDGVLAIEFAREHRADFGGVDIAGKLIQTAGQIANHVLALLGPVDENAEVVGLASERRGQRLVAFQTAPPLQYLLCVVLVFPEIRRRGLRFQLA
jgi:hypothetical protein